MERAKKLRFLARSFLASGAYGKEIAPVLFMSKMEYKLLREYRKLPLAAPTSAACGQQSLWRQKGW